MPDSNRTVLIVEDDQDILLIGATYFRDLGFDVLEATNGDEGLRVLEERSDIDLLFTDIVMPGDIDGFELAHRAVQKRPSIRVIYTSGYMKTLPWGEMGIGYGRLLAKPWRRDGLKIEVDRLFNPRPNNSP
jgi:hypothetical protein